MFLFFFQSQIFLLFVSLSFLSNHIICYKNVYLKKKKKYPRTYEKTGSANVLQEFFHF